MVWRTWLRCQLVQSYISGVLWLPEVSDLVENQGSAAASLVKLAPSPELVDVSIGRLEGDKLRVLAGYLRELLLRDL
jgi:hypothetical protein